MARSYKSWLFGVALRPGRKEGRKKAVSSLCLSGQSFPRLTGSAGAARFRAMELARARSQISSRISGPRGAVLCHLIYDCGRDDCQNLASHNSQAGSAQPSRLVDHKLRRVRFAEERGRKPRGCCCCCGIAMCTYS